MTNQDIKIKRSILFASVLMALLLLGCDSFGSDKSPDYRKTNAVSANFGFRAVYGLNDVSGSDDVLELSGGFLYNADDQRVSPSDGQASLKFNDVPVTSDDFEFEFTPGRDYTVTATPNGESVSGSVTAPSISEIEFTSLPDTVATDQEIEVAWTYPEGEENDGAIIVQAGRYSSGMLEPSTTSHTIPAGALERQTGSVDFSVLSVRYVLFPNLTNPSDPSVVFIEELDPKGSFFATVVGVGRFVEVEQP